MGIFIGAIEKKSGYFNYRPIAKLDNSRVIELSPQEQEELLPESEKRNICLSYNWHDESEYQRMNDSFPEKSLVLFEFSLPDLQDNLKQNGDRNQTGYKVSAMEMLDEGKIRPIGCSGIYYAVHKNEILSDFKNDVIVEIESPCILANNQVFVELDDFWAGPYTVGYREYTSSYYIKPQIKEQKYTVRGYSSDQMNQFDLKYSEGYWESTETRWLLLIPKPDAIPKQMDVIPDSVLIESFKDSVKNGMTTNGQIRLDDVPSLLKQYEESEVAGSILSEETRRTRLNRLVSIMSSEEDVDDTLHTITDFVCDLLIKYQDSPNVDEWLKAVLEKNPQLLDKLQRTSSVSKRIAELEDKLDELTSQKESIEKEIEETRQRAESIDQQAIEAKKHEMLEKEKEYTELSSRIEASKKVIGIVDNIGELQKKYDVLKDEVSYLESHKNHLASDTNSLELKFQQLISEQQEKMVEIAFDGFMSSKMLHAAAEWEAERSNSQHLELTDKVINIQAQDKAPKEVIEYLCNAVKACRPNYDKNTIINIAICITQGFLTVFSGEPGCGKTSICNIMGNVLGLNKISDLVGCSDEIKDSVNRYVAISVERGWTSKRDFVGYYNPLSKTFDKSNRRVYDALYQLDIEKKKNVFKLPYIILLDEANLSPMEYYWSDFMNVCDDLDAYSKVNLGEDYVFGIPETLHFVATINNDHTTETLSPRLIDRSWVVTLPQPSMKDYSSSVGEVSVPPDKTELISWNSLREAFIPKKEECVFSSEIQKCYDAIITKLRERKILVSPRINRAIKQYWAVASKCFEIDDTKTAPAIIALDYAIAQRILPKIAGSGDEFEKWLKEFGGLCSSNGLNLSATIVKGITDRGNQQMKYYQFFY